jgi:prevent-host-death family protein
LTRLVHQAEQGQAIELTRHGRPVAVILSKKAYEDLAAGHRPSLSEAFEKFRSWADLEAITEGRDEFEDVRDQSPGRKVRL